MLNRGDILRDMPYINKYINKYKLFSILLCWLKINIKNQEEFYREKVKPGRHYADYACINKYINK
jgi:hypothetical protein